MANYEESTNIKLDWAMPMQRTGKFPLDRSSMFSSYNDAVKYAKGDTSDPDSRGLCGSSYIGQQICVYENDEVKLYVIDQDRALKNSNSDSIMWVTFTEDASKTLTADKSVAEIYEAYSNGLMIYGIFFDIDINTEMIMPCITSTNTIAYFETITESIIRMLVGQKDKWGYATAQAQLVNNLTTAISSTSTDDEYPSVKATYNYGQAIKTLDLTNTTSNQIVSIATVDDNGAPKSYSTLDIASDDDVNTMITEVLGSYSTQQQPSSIILNSNTTNSTKQFELTIDDTGTLTSQEL